MNYLIKKVLAPYQTSDVGQGARHLQRLVIQVWFNVSAQEYDHARLHFPAQVHGRDFQVPGVC